MIEGFVNERLEAVVPLRLRGIGGKLYHIEAIIDTGFSGSISLPSSLLASFSLQCLGEGRAILADGSTGWFNLFSADLEWEGELKYVMVASMGEETLLGTALLVDFSLKIEFEAGGKVQIVPLGPR